MSMTLHMGKIIKAFAEMKHDIPLELKRVMNWQMALVVQNVMINSGVKLDSELNLGGGSSKLASQKRHQEDTIAQQLNNLFKAPGNGWRLRPNNKKGAEPGEMRAKKGKSIFFVNSEHSNIGFTSMFKIHKSHRGKFGQLHFAGQPYKIGKKTYSSNSWVKTKTILKDYIKVVQSHIGKTKASWNYALDYFTAKSNGYAKWVPPSWVTRHGRMWGGEASEQFDAVAMTGTWVAGTNVPWVKDLSLGSKIQFAIRMRMLDLEGGFALKKLKGLIEKHNA